jgi:hypothetical protein
MKKVETQKKLLSLCTNYSTGWNFEVNRKNLEEQQKMKKGKNESQNKNQGFLFGRPTPMSLV